MASFSKNEKLTILILGVFYLAYQMSSIFLNLFLYAYTNSNMVTMAEYTIVRIAMFPIFFVAGGKLSTKKGYALTICLSFLIMAGQLFYVLLFNSYFADHNALIFVAGLIGGIGEGYFWLTMNALQQIVAAPDYLALFVSVSGMFNNIGIVLAPVVANLFLKLGPTEMDGYLHIFLFIGAVFIVLSILSLQLKVRPKQEDFSALNCFRSKDKLWRVNLKSTFLYGIRDSLTIILINLILFEALGSRSISYSRYMVVFSLITIAAYYICSRHMKTGSVMKSYLISSILVASASIVMVIFYNRFGGLYYGIVNYAFSPMYTNGYSILGMDCINRFKTTENISGRLIAREWSLEAGRIVGMGMIIAANRIFSHELYLLISVITISSFAMINVLYVRHAYHRLGYDRFG